MLLTAVELFGDPLARRVVASLTDELPTRVSVERYDLSLLRSFPHLSVQLRDIHIEGSDGRELLGARRLGCRLDLLSVFSRPEVTQVSISDGQLLLYTDVDGNTNYNFQPVGVGDKSGADSDTPPLEGPGEGGATEFNVVEALLANITLVYQDAQLAIDATLRIDEARLAGDFGADRYRLQTEGDLTVAYLDLNGRRYLADRPFTVGGHLAIDHTDGAYRFAPLAVSSGRLAVELSGTLSSTPAGVHTDLAVTATAAGLDEVLALAPPAYAPTLAEVETRGGLTAEATLKGGWIEKSLPRLTGRLSFTDGSLSSPRLGVAARDLQLAADFDYDNGQNFYLRELTGTFAGRPFAIQLDVRRLDDPTVDLRATGSLPLSLFVHEAQGLLRLDDIRISGSYADMRSPVRAARVRAEGSAILDGGSLPLGDGRLELPDGELHLVGNRLRLEDLGLRTDGTDVVVNGYVPGILPYLFQEQDTRVRALRFKAMMTGERVAVEDVMDLFGGEDDGGEGSATPLDGEFGMDVERWTYADMEGRNFRGELIVNPGKLEVRGKTSAMGGEFRLDATTYLGTTDVLQARIAADGVNARELFRQTGNLGQEILTADHLTGRMNARLLLDLPYNADGVDYDNLHARASLEILDGQLNDFELLENFAFALKTGDLERVRFTRLANYLEVRNRRVYLPAMFIRSSAMNLTLSGVHTFDQELDYAVRVNAGQVLANKLRRHDRNLELLPARRNGFFNLHYTIRGPLQTYNVITDRRGVLGAFAESRGRRARLRRELEAAFQTPIQLEDDM